MTVSASDSISSRHSSNETTFMIPDDGSNTCRSGILFQCSINIKLEDIWDIAINTTKIAPASFCNRAVHGNMISRLHFQITEVAQLRTVHPPAYEIYRCRIPSTSAEVIPFSRFDPLPEEPTMFRLTFADTGR
nr:hypothetical protein Iba_chr14fCG7710 [Ipomoea batatas]